MASLREIRKRIKSVKSIHGITKAMELISAVRYKKIERRFKGSSPYYTRLEELLGRVVDDTLINSHPLFEKREVKKELIIMIAGDRGLCGGFNSLLGKELLRQIDPNVTTEIFTIGKVAKAFCEKQKLSVFDSWIDIGYDFTAVDIRGYVDRFVELYLSGEFDRVRILCTDFQKSGSYSQVAENFLDLSYLKENRAETTDVPYIFEPERQSVAESLIQLFIRQRFYTFLLRSVAAEYFARMLAMKQATDNGKDVIDNLTLLRNKVRQAMITRELSEIIGGSEALN